MGGLANQVLNPCNQPISLVNLVGNRTNFTPV
jgi:hypothetical protein